LPGEKSEIPKSNAFWVLESVILFYYPKNYYVTGFLACSRLGVDKKLLNRISRKYQQDYNLVHLTISANQAGS
jgi:hypothetical protein